MAWYLGLITIIAVERLAELVVSARNLAWSKAHGGTEHGLVHYPAMVVLHISLFVGCAVEPLLFSRSFVPALGWPMLIVVVVAQVLRWWCITTLGRQWNTRVVVVPGAPRVIGGPYRLIKHPNYVAVVLEGFALPLVHSAWLTAIAFTALNAMLLRTRITVEDRALASLGAGLPHVTREELGHDRPAGGRRRSCRLGDVATCRARGAGGSPR